MDSRIKEVYVIKERDQGDSKLGSDGKPRAFWVRIGRAFVNRDGSLNVHLDAVPMDGKLHIRDPKPREGDATAPARPLLESVA